MHKLILHCSWLVKNLYYKSLSPIQTNTEFRIQLFRYTIQYLTSSHIKTLNFKLELQMIQCTKCWSVRRGKKIKKTDLKSTWQLPWIELVQIHYGNNFELNFEPFHFSFQVIPHQFLIGWVKTKSRWQWCPSRIHASLDYLIIQKQPRKKDNR